MVSFSCIGRPNKLNKGEMFMVTQVESTSPFYLAYISQAEIVNDAVEKAIQESAAKMGDSVTKIYSIRSNVFLNKKTA